MITFGELRAGAEDWLATAEESRRAGRYHVSYEAARQAAELAGKVLLLRATGKFPKEHAIAGALAQAGVLPDTLDRRALQKFLQDFTRGTYGFDRRLVESDVALGIEMARAMVIAVMR